MITPQSASRRAVIEMMANLQWIPLEDNLVVFRFETGAAPNQPSAAAMGFSYTPTVQEGFTTPEHIEAFQTGKAANIPMHPQHLRLFEPDFRVQLQHTPRGALNASPISRPFAAALAGTLDVDNILFDDYSLLMVFDRKGNVVPAANDFSYINGKMANNVYHLDKVVQVLNADPRVRPIPPEQRTRRQNRQNPQPAGLVIEEIPYYNCTQASYLHVPFLFTPTFEQAQILWATQRRMDAKYPSTAFHKAVFELDMLGLRAAGAAKYPTYWGVDRSEDNSDN